MRGSLALFDALPQSKSPSPVYVRIRFRVRFSLMPPQSILSHAFSMASRVDSDWLSVVSCRVRVRVKVRVSASLLALRVDSCSRSSSLLTVTS